MTGLYDRIVDKNLLIRRVCVNVDHVVEERAASRREVFEQLSLFTDYEERDRLKEAQAAELRRERKIQETMLEIKKRYGKNAILRGMNLEDGAMIVERNRQIGGHRA